MVDLNKEKEVWQKEVNDNTEIIGEETSAIRSTKQEMLKYHGMVDANKAAQKTMEAASDEIVGMIVQEAKDSIDEEQEEAVEKAEEKQEEKEQQEAIREERKAEMEQIQKPIQDLPDLQQAQREIEQSVNEILQQQKLLKEDLKGIKVDTAR